MLRRGRKEVQTSDGIVNSALVVYDKPWYSASCNLGPPKGKSFQGSNLTHNRNASIASSNDTVVNGTLVTRRSGRPASLEGDRQKRAVSGSGRYSKTQEPGPSGSFCSPSNPIEDLELTPRSAGEKALRSILKHETNTMRPKSSQDLSLRKQSDDDSRSCASPTSTHLSPNRQQSGQMAPPAALPPPPFRQSRIPRFTLLNSNGDFRQASTQLPARSQSSNEWCHGRPKFSRKSPSPSPARRVAAGAKKTSDAKEKQAQREWVVTGGGKCDWGVAAGSRSVPGYDAAGSGNRRSESSDSNYDRKVSRRHSENDVRRSTRKSPRMDEEFQSARSSWSSHIDIVTVNPSPQQLSQSVGHITTPRSISSDTSGSDRPYYRRVFENMYDWLTTFADTQWSNLKLIKRVAENYVVPVKTKAKRTASYPERLQCSKSNHLTTYSGSKTSPSANSNSNAPANLAEQTAGFSSTTHCRSRTSSSDPVEQYPSLHGGLSPEEKWDAIRKQQQQQQQQQHKNPGDPKQGNSRSELKSMTLEGQSSHFRTSSSPGGRPSNLTTCSSAMELAGSRLDRMQESAADAITQMRGPEFVMPRKLLKSETLLTKSLTKEFEETANMPSTCRRTAQLRKLLSELPAENYYVVEWLVTNSIVNESNASSFGRLFKVKPNVLEVLTRHRDHLFPL